MPGRKLGPWSEFPFLYRFTILLNSGGSNSPWSEFWSEFPHFMGMGVGPAPSIFQQLRFGVFREGVFQKMPALEGQFLKEIAVGFAGENCVVYLEWWTSAQGCLGVESKLNRRVLRCSDANPFALWP